ncbi:hypothetical protein CBF34_08575 [Vagococcus penaei]|uniref:Uncharacterized protein n=1 Tax=Vagococcus penaei TaxID=633807 RepID=A0A1Q2D7B5_9ENTE|nr:hypothetical protein [Vagococcus penaei]AQP54175.1 hypothetical protein BW732_08040 [Vagococcus penaei]RST99956.1 hypothetical protein CBF34_08575 [Vagococcus penaei]
MEQNQQNQQKPKSSKVGMIVIILVIIAVIGGGYLAFSKMSSSPSAKQEEKNKTTDGKTDSSESPEMKARREALDGVMTLFDNGDPTRARTDIKPEEFKKVQAKIDKVKDDRIKKELTAKMDDISKASKGDGDMSKTADASNDSTVSSGENDN